MCIVDDFLDGALSELNATQKMIRNKTLSSLKTFSFIPSNFCDPLPSQFKATWETME